MKAKLKHILLWIKLENANIKGALKVLLWVSVPIFIWYQAPRILRNFVVQNMDSQTVAVVDTLILVNGFNSSRLGETPVVKFYKIHYHFKVNEVYYQNEESIARETLSIKKRAKVGRLTKGDSLKIKYDEVNPQKSFIDFEE